MPYKNKLDRNANNRKKYRRNRDSIREYNKKWRANNKGKTKQYYQENRERILNQKKEYYLTKKEQLIHDSFEFLLDKMDGFKKPRKSRAAYANKWYHNNIDRLRERYRAYGRKAAKKNKKHRDEYAKQYYQKNKILKVCQRKKN